MAELVDASRVKFRNMVEFHAIKFPFEVAINSNTAFLVEVRPEQ